MTQSFILIDGSYFIFYRYFALMNWWKHAKREDAPILENNNFLDKFEKLFIEKIKEIKKKLKIKDAYLLVAKDCSRNHIWRNTLYSNYKSTRDNNGLETLGACFKHAYTNNLFQKGGCYHKILSHPGLEADDCIALFTNYITNKIPNSIIYIVASDADYMQLKTPEINIVNLKYQSIDEWDSVGHMGLIAEIEEAFGIELEMDDVIDFSSYVKGKEILKKYNVEIL